MIDTDRYEELRLLISEFNDGSKDSADDIDWGRHLETYESLPEEVKRLKDMVERTVGYGAYDEEYWRNEE